MTLSSLKDFNSQAELYDEAKGINLLVDYLFIHQNPDALTKSEISEEIGVKTNSEILQIIGRKID